MFAVDHVICSHLVKTENFVNSEIVMAIGEQYVAGPVKSAEPYATI